MAAQPNLTGGTTTFGSQTARADTLADRQAFLTDGLAPVSCHTCGTQVLVRKNSEKHTSIQWTSDPARSCAVYAGRVAGGADTALLDTCERLSESIAQAVADGDIVVGAPQDASSAAEEGP